MLANFTVIGSVAPLGFWPFSPLMASSASILLSKRMNPTPLETPGEGERAFVKSAQTVGRHPWEVPRRCFVVTRSTCEASSLNLCHSPKGYLCAFLPAQLCADVANTQDTGSISLQASVIILPSLHLPLVTLTDHPTLFSSAKCLPYLISGTVTYWKSNL